MKDMYISKQVRKNNRILLLLGEEKKKEKEKPPQQYWHKTFELKVAIVTQTKYIVQVFFLCNWCFEEFQHFFFQVRTFQS